MSKKLGNLIKEARTAKGLTQAALADQTGGITSSDISKIERGEKEPAQDVLKKMAKVLGVTQKSLLEAASGSAASSGKKPSSGTVGKTAGKTGSTGKKPSSSGKTSSGKTSSSGSLNLTATEKRLVELYRKADSSTKKAAMNLLKGDGNPLELLGTMLTSGSDVSEMASGLFGSLLSGKKEMPEELTRSPEVPEEE